MNSKSVEIVRPVNSRGEVTWFGVACLIVLVAWTLGIHARSPDRGMFTHSDRQVSAFHDLNMAEQGLFADLRTAAEEILDMYMNDNGSWPRLSRLQEEGIAPFARDVTWKNRGRHAWTDRVALRPGEESIVFIGMPADRQTSGAFLMEVHNHEEGEKHEPPYEIWYHAHRPKPLADTSKPSLVRAGWKEVKPYLGEDEVKRLRGMTQ